VIDLELSEPRGVTGFEWKIWLAIFFLLFGAGGAFVVMALPWYLAVVWHDRQRFGPIYFPMVGAVATLVLGSAASSLAPEPLFVEDQTFLQGFTIAVERQGVCLLLTGAVFGLTYWLVSERRRESRLLKTA
jgi:hypothetical protein